MPKEQSKSIDLLSIKWVFRLAKSKWFPSILQVFTLAVFVLLIYGGLGITSSDAQIINELRNTNVANLIVWSYWWPLIIIAAVLFGRIWCTVCPVELITFVCSRVGLKRNVPKLLKTGWLITVFYAVILLVGIHTLTIHRIPHRMAIYLLALIAVAVIVSLIFEKRAFCSYVCPVGYLLGLYSLLSPLKWRALDKSVCGCCKEKNCISNKNQHKLFGRSCSSGLYPASIENNQDCILCTQCLKSCPNNNIQFSIKRPFADFPSGINLKYSQAAFIFILSGFVVYEVLSEWSVSKSILMLVPEYLTGLLHLSGPDGSFVNAFILFIIFPAAGAFGILLAARAFAKVHAGDFFGLFALILIPTMAAAHIIKAILKMVPRLPYWNFAFKDPAGVQTAQGLVDKTIELNKSIPESLALAVSVISVMLLLIALAATIVIFRKADFLKSLSAGARYIILAGTIIYWGFFAVTIAAWRVF